MVGIVLFGWDKGKARINLVSKLMTKGPKTARRRLMNRLAASGRDETRKNITSQGRGTWPKLSAWTMAQTGRRKALITLRKFVGVKKAGPSAIRASTIFRSPGDFTLTQHHTGFTEPPEAGIVKIELKRPGVLGNKGKLQAKGKSSVAFRDTKTKVVPPRPVWPSRRQVKALIRKNVAKWRDDMIRALERKR